MSDKKDYLKSKCKTLIITQPFWGNQKVTAAQAIGAMESYHQAKSKEEGKERNNLALQSLPNVVQSWTFDNVMKAIRLAAFGKEGEG